MAPEILNEVGYFCSVDWWSLGVIMYELIYGERPFRSKHRKELIKKGSFKFHPTLQVSEECKDAISGFLRMEAHTRLGVGFEGMVALKRHKFFNKIDWEKLSKKQLYPVYVPGVATSETGLKDVEIDDLLKAFKEPNSKRNSSKIMSSDMLTIYYEFSYYDYRFKTDPDRYRMEPVSRDALPVLQEESSNDVTDRLLNRSYSTVGNGTVEMMSRRASVRSVLSSKVGQGNISSNSVVGKRTSQQDMNVALNAANSLAMNTIKRRHSFSVDNGRLPMIPQAIALPSEPSEQYQEPMTNYVPLPIVAPVVKKPELLEVRAGNAKPVMRRRHSVSGGQALDIPIGGFQSALSGMLEEKSRISSIHPDV
jgi:serine/threonine protein kinase